MFIYNKNPEFNVATVTIAAEVRNIIQNWRKANKLPIDYRVPTLYVWFNEPIIKSALIEGRCEACNDTHVFEICQVDKVEMQMPPEDFKELDNHDYDFICWSPLGGSVGFGDVLDDSKNSIKYAIEHKHYDQW